MEDALFDNRSHRLLIRCTSSNVKKRDFIHQSECNCAQSNGGKGHCIHHERALSAHGKNSARKIEIEEDEELNQREIVEEKKNDTVV